MKYNYYLNIYIVKKILIFNGYFKFKIANIQFYKFYNNLKKVFNIILIVLQIFFNKSIIIFT